MADRSVVARNESHGSEASEASMFCFDRKVLLRRGSGLLYFAVPTSCCVFECHEKGYKSSTVHFRKLRENSGEEGKAFTFAVELKFVRFISG